MEPAQVKALAHKIWIAEYRINDLLTHVHPEKWKTSNVTRNSFNQTLENLHKALEGLEEWRAQFEKRPDSMYFGFQTYAAMNAALPRLDGVARAVSQFENPSLGAQYSQAGNQLFDLQQALQPYVAYLLRNPDQPFMWHKPIWPDARTNWAMHCVGKEDRPSPSRIPLLSSMDGGIVKANLRQLTAESPLGAGRRSRQARPKRKRNPNPKT